jgi:hypothetical protein
MIFGPSMIKLAWFTAKTDNGKQAYKRCSQEIFELNYPVQSLSDKRT